MFIQYRLFSEHSLWRLLEINKNENYISVNELKNIICKQSNINYNNKIDIYFSIYKDEDNNEYVNNKDKEKELKYLNSDDKIYNGTKILVHRNIKKKSNVSDITHKAKKEITLNVEEKQKINIPNEFLCKLCNLILLESYIIVCNNNCGYSVCKNCILFYILNTLIKENERKVNYIDLSLLNDNVKCPICNGFLKYCILNKKIELTLEKLQDERNDIDSYNLNIDERNNKFLKIIEKLKIENFDYINKNNIFDNEIFEIIKKKFIYSNVNKNYNRTTKTEENKIFHHFLYLMESNKLNCIKEYNMIYIDFDSLIFDSIQKISVKNIYEEIQEKNREENVVNDNNNIYDISDINKNLNTDDCNNELNNKKDDESCNKTLTNNVIKDVLISANVNSKCVNENDNNKNFNLNDENSNTNDETKNIKDNSTSEIDDELYNKNKTYIMPISFVGGETSYSLIGVFYIKELFIIINDNNKIDNEIDENKKKIIQNFLKKWFHNENQNNENILEKLNYGNIYKVDYVNKYEKTCFFPAKKQPIYNIINNKRQKNKKKNNIEIILDLKKFKDVILSVHNYIRYGSRPTYYDVKKTSATNNTEDEEKKNYMMTREKADTPCSSIDTNENQLNIKLNEESKQKNAISTNAIIKENGFQEIFEILYDTKIAPLSIQNNFNINNPYAGYCALLPFLTKQEFDFIRKLQRIYKEKYLKELYKYVKKNNLHMNIFYNAVNAIFFSTIKQ
ncbi:conserved Plasmodium protein, unknown function [Plasmodium gallinaceum]|uniref:RING-type domain-containing protein n=1 Tax=Plasmodium gallinaceum TaxID=5849 RepID=A0A1J1GPR9_PLAGA|nr:conserved Plasmodium protein, unknown function [Plasmodium gallinaceum]CRG93287.1 conserved Plasmodium protein, unknown function [Plasmodium gallinaceum]